MVELLEIMLKRAWITVGIAAVLLTGWIPGGDACGLGEAIGHDCCAPEPTMFVESCCSSDDAPAREDDNGQGMDCTCDHPPAIPAAVPTAGNDGTEQQLSLVAIGERPDTGNDTAHQPVREHRIRSHPPAPAYLLNAAFLN